MYFMRNIIAEKVHDEKQLEREGRLLHTEEHMAIDTSIDPQIQILLQFADEEVLTHTIWSLTGEQKKSHLFKQLGEQRYLSSLRAGAIDNAELTRTAFQMDPFFLKSKIVTEAAQAGFQSEIARGNLARAARIKEVMGLPDLLPVVAPPTSPEEGRSGEQHTAPN